MGELLDAANALVSPVEKLIDAVQSAIGKAYEPRHVKKLADAKAYEIATIGKALRENSDIPIIYDKESISIDTTDFDEFAKRAQNRLAFQELTKQRNIESVIDVAYSELEGQDAVTDEPIDPDWVISFFNSVEDISNNKMHQLWGKLLAGEIKQPNSFSKRTLNVLKNLTEKEASLFQKIIPYLLTCPGNKAKSVEDHFLLCRGTMLAKYEITFPDIMLLDEAGLLSLNDQIYAGFTLEPNQSEMFVCRSTNKAIKIKNIVDSEVSIFHPSYLLTESGKALVPIARKHGFRVPSDSYLIDCLNEIKEHDFNRDIFVSDNNKVSIEIVSLESL